MSHWTWREYALLGVRFAIDVNCLKAPKVPELIAVQQFRLFVVDAHKEPTLPASQDLCECLFGWAKVLAAPAAVAFLADSRPHDAWHICKGRRCLATKQQAFIGVIEYLVALQTHQSPAQRDAALLKRYVVHTILRAVEEVGAKSGVRTVLWLDGNVAFASPIVWRYNDEVAMCEAIDAATGTSPVRPQLEDQRFAVRQG